jgi:hypothetical protein
MTWQSARYAAGSYGLPIALGTVVAFPAVACALAFGVSS